MINLLKMFSFYSFCCIGEISFCLAPSTRYIRVIYFNTINFVSFNNVKCFFGIFTKYFWWKNIKKSYQDTMTTNIIFGINQTSKKCESIVIQMVINNLWRIKCGKNWKKPLNMIEWRIIPNKTRKSRQKNTKILWQPISFFGIKQLHKVGIDCSEDGENSLCRQ